jgi:hypothetical protein
MRQELFRRTAWRGRDLDPRPLRPQPVGHSRRSRSSDRRTLADERRRRSVRRGSLSARFESTQRSMKPLGSVLRPRNVSSRARKRRGSLGPRDQQRAGADSTPSATPTDTLHNGATSGTTPAMKNWRKVGVRRGPQRLDASFIAVRPRASTARRRHVPPRTRPAVHSGG